MSFIAPAPMPPEVQQRMARLLPPGMPAPNLFRAVARNQGLFCQLVDSGLLGPTGLLDGRRLPRELREAIILRTCAATANRYEWQLHVGTISARMGLTAAQIEDSWGERPNAGLWSPQQLAAFDIVDTLVARRPIGTDQRQAWRALFDDPALIEIAQLVGLYAGVAMMVALVEPELDAYSAPLPANKV